MSQEVRDSADARREDETRVALVTGASRGVGALTARLLGERGVNVVVNYRHKARRAEQVVAEIEQAGAKGQAVQADITNAESVHSMLSTIRDTLGQLDLLILNASGGLEKDVPDDYAIRLNKDAQVGLVEAALPMMASGGRIVFVTSHLAHFHGTKPVMPEYEIVASTKKAGEDALRSIMPRMAAAGVSFIVVSGDLIEGTITPRLLNRMRPGVIDQRREAAGWLPTTEDFARAIVTAALDQHQESGATMFVGSTE
jgi:NAD(P)-dependent dehydrogenase (short-subunit alcohol dehydrogenase family)